MLQKVQMGFQIFSARLQEQGLATVFIWIYNRGLSYLTGVPRLHRSRITEQVYVGSQFNQHGLEVLRREGISAVVNMRIERDDAEAGLLLEEYCYLPTIDDEAPSEAHIDEGIQFIRRMVSEGRKVYIHCAGGIGRAPTMAAAYFIAEGASVEEAIARIQDVRPYIRIMPPQMELLRKLETRREQRLAEWEEAGFVLQ